MRRLMLALLTVSGLISCDDGAGDRREQSDRLERSEEQTGSAANDRLRVSAFQATLDESVAGSEGDAASSAASGDDAGIDYSDEELLGILLAIHDTEVILGRAAQRATDPRIQTLGADVVTAHEEGRSRTRSFGIFPAPSQQAAVYFEAGLTLRTMLLGEESGDNYDDTYLSLQIMLDVLVSHQIDTIWLPTAESPELQAELTATRDAMQAHAERAAAIRTERHPPRSHSPADAGTTEPTGQDSGTSEPTEPGDEPQAEPDDSVVL